MTTLGTVQSPEIPPEKDWHAITPEEVLARLGAQRDGLDQAEARRRLEAFGPNELPYAPGPTLVEILLRQCQNPLIYILLAAAVVAAVFGSFKDAILVGIVLVANALIGGYQEWRADQSSRALQKLLQIRAAVVRDGETHDVDAAEIVPGDVVRLESGSRVPADMRLLSAHGLEIDESLLTGESLAVLKDPAWAATADAALGDQRNMAFAGSIVVRGRGVGVIAETGTRTEVGRLAVDVLATGGGESPLMERLGRFSKMIGITVVTASVLVGIVGVMVHDHPLYGMILFGIAMAVAAIPEGLPITVTIALAMATRRMARRGVIVRRLAAVEGLGSCTLIASDKTGTLTCNELTIRAIHLPCGTSLDVTGEGFVPDGEVLLQGTPIDPARVEALAGLLRVAVLCNEADLHRRHGQWSWRGDPTDIALLSLAHKLGWTREQTLLANPETHGVPFEAERRFAATFNRTPEGLMAFVKGAPERVLEMCDFGTQGAVAELLQAARQMAEQGYRVLALASGPVADDGLGAAEPPELAGLGFVGFVGMIDPLRPGVREAVADCRRAGVGVCMVTGDHPVTALAIARNVGLLAPSATNAGEQVITGRELEGMSDEELQNLIRRVCVFARVAPRQKLQLVEAARAIGHYVAVTGDGVNDGPALRSANIGVAMGKSGTDVAREAAELVIGDDNFTTIVAGIEEGRVAYDNIRKVIFLLVSTGATEVLLLSVAVLVGDPLPLLPAQILWLNLVTSGLQDKPLALEPAEGDILRRPPRAPREPIFDRLMIERIVVVALVMGGVGYGVFHWALAGAPDDPDAVAHARNILLLFLVLAKAFHLAASRSETSFAFTLSPLKSPVLMACALAAVLIHLVAMYLPSTRWLLQASPVGWDHFALLAALGMTVFVAMELHKWVWKLRHPARR